MGPNCSQTYLRGRLSIIARWAAFVKEPSVCNPRRIAPVVEMSQCEPMLKRGGYFAMPAVRAVCGGFDARCTLMVRFLSKSITAP
jgi:hypothetical protein